MKFSEFIIFISLLSLGSFICVSDGLFDIPSAYYTRAHYYIDFTTVNLRLWIGLLFITASAVSMASKTFGKLFITAGAIALTVFLANPAAYLLYDEHQATIGQILIKTVSIFGISLIR